MSMSRMYLWISLALFVTAVIALALGEAAGPVTENHSMGRGLVAGFTWLAAAVCAANLVLALGVRIFVWQREGYDAEREKRPPRDD